MFPSTPATAKKVAPALRFPHGLAGRHDDKKLAAASATVEKAVAQVVAEGKTLTYDLGGSSKTSEVGDAIVKTIRRAA